MIVCLLSLRIGNGKSVGQACPDGNLLFGQDFRDLLEQVRESVKPACPGRRAKNALSGKGRDIFDCLLV
jgi:hypothetical protein